MLNAIDLVEAWADKLEAATALMTALGTGAEAIAHVDTPDGNLRAALLSQPRPSIRVVYTGRRPVRIGSVVKYRYGFSFYAFGAGTAEAQSPMEIEAAFCAAVVGLAVVSGCYPVGDLNDLPETRRNSIVVSADGATVDYWEFAAALVEI